MGGSKGSFPVGSGIGSTAGSGCPRKFETKLVDIFQTGNVDYAMNIDKGELIQVSISENGTSILFSHKGRNIGYLPPHFNNIIDCINLGWKYTATILEISKDINKPMIEVMVIGIP